MKFYKIKNGKIGEEISIYDASRLRSNEYIKITECMTCKNNIIGAMYLKDKGYECTKCYMKRK